MTGIAYRAIDEAGLHVALGDREQLIPADSIILCAGQEPDDRLARPLAAAGIPCDLIGGARLATELDAARAIDEGTRLAQRL
jgi:2,4-dienoyl-CoA reductase (NADPH2)